MTIFGRRHGWKEKGPMGVSICSALIMVTEALSSPGLSEPMLKALELLYLGKDNGWGAKMVTYRALFRRGLICKTNGLRRLGVGGGYPPELTEKGQQLCCTLFEPR